MPAAAAPERRRYKLCALCGLEMRNRAYLIPKDDTGRRVLPPIAAAQAQENGATAGATHLHAGKGEECAAKVNQERNEPQSRLRSAGHAYTPAPSKPCAPRQADPCLDELMGHQPAAVLSSAPLLRPRRPAEAATPSSSAARSAQQKELLRAAVEQLRVEQVMPCARPPGVGVLGVGRCTLACSAAVCAMWCATWCVSHGVCLMVCVTWCVPHGVCYMVCAAWCVCHMVCATWCVQVRERAQQERADRAHARAGSSGGVVDEDEVERSESGEGEEDAAEESGDEAGRDAETPVRRPRRDRFALGSDRTYVTLSTYEQAQWRKVRTAALHARTQELVGCRQRLEAMGAQLETSGQVADAMEAAQAALEAQLDDTQGLREEHELFEKARAILEGHGLRCAPACPVCAAFGAGTSGEQPAASSQQPAASSQQPVASSQQPAASSQQSAASSQQPAASS